MGGMVDLCRQDGLDAAENPQSRAMWGELVFDLTIESLRRSLVRAAMFFEGVPRQWLFDNPKIVVLERHGDAVRYHPSLLEIAGDFRVQPRLCRPRRPTDKGGVERAVRYLRDRFFAARTITSVEDGNRQLVDFLRDIANTRPHPRFRDRTVGDVLAEEKEKLLALPQPLPETDLVVPTSVDSTAFVRFGTNLYSVPARYARSRDTLTLVASDTEVRLLDMGDVVARHARSWGKHQRIEDPEHRRELLEQKRAAHVPKGRDRLLAEVAGIDALYNRWLDVGRNIGLMTVRVGKLSISMVLRSSRRPSPTCSHAGCTIREPSRSAVKRRDVSPRGRCPWPSSSASTCPTVTSSPTTSGSTTAAAGRDEQRHRRPPSPHRALRSARSPPRPADPRDQEPPPA
jgi:hypothetical protein